MCRRAQWQRRERGTCPRERRFGPKVGSFFPAGSTLGAPPGAVITSGGGGGGAGSPRAGLAAIEACRLTQQPCSTGFSASGAGATAATTSYAAHCPCAALRPSARNAQPAHGDSRRDWWRQQQLWRQQHVELCGPRRHRQWSRATWQQQRRANSDGGDCSAAVLDPPHVDFHSARNAISHAELTCTSVSCAGWLAFLRRATYRSSWPGVRTSPNSHDAPSNNAKRSSHANIVTDIAGAVANATTSRSFAPRWRGPRRHIQRCAHTGRANARLPCDHSDSQDPGCSAYASADKDSQCGRAEGLA